MSSQNVSPGYTNGCIGSADSDIVDQLIVTGSGCEVCRTQVDAEKVIDGLRQIRRDVFAEDLDKPLHDGVEGALLEEELIQCPVDELVKRHVRCYACGKLVEEALVGFRLGRITEHADDHRSRTAYHVVELLDCRIEVIHLRVVEVKSAEELVDEVTAVVDGVFAAEDEYDYADQLLNGIRIVEYIVDDFSNRRIERFGDKRLDELGNAFCVVRSKDYLKKCYEGINLIAGDVLVSRNVSVGRIDHAVGVVLLRVDLEKLCAGGVLFGFVCCLSHHRSDLVPVKVKSEVDYIVADLDFLNQRVEEVRKVSGGNVDRYTGCDARMLLTEVSCKYGFACDANLLKVDRDCGREYVVDFLGKLVDRSDEVLGNGVDAVGADEVEEICKS